MSIKVFTDSEKVSEAAALLFIEEAKKAVKKNGKFTVALSGGNSPRRTYELLASKPLINQVPWHDTHIFWGDERFVPPNDPENNARMAREVLLDHVPVPFDQIFPVPTDSTPSEAAETYASTLASVFGNSIPVFDLMLLGLGQNGHTASLFPNKEVLNEKNRWTGSVYLKDKKQSRITLTAPVINHAKNIVFLVYGESKAAVLHSIVEGAYKPTQFPAQLVDPSNGSLYWYVDEDAASKLQDQEVH